MKTKLLSTGSSLVIFLKIPLGGHNHNGSMSRVSEGRGQGDLSPMNGQVETFLPGNFIRFAPVIPLI
jgi:hypothetical protein